ncbi:hypothetical protein JCM11641_007266 [Rhodosporidiobolus odoratus]
MANPPPIPPRPLSSASDPHMVWGASAPVPPPVPQPTSVVGSVRSVGSSARRARAAEIADAARRERQAQFEANEERIKNELEQDLEQADQKSLAQGVTRGVVQPPPGEEGESVVLQRQLAEVNERKATLEPIIATRQSSTPNPITTSSENNLVQPSSDYDDVIVRKVSAPKAWTGEFHHRKREAWIKTALGYLASVGIPPSTRLVEAAQPGVFYQLRSFFSSDARTSSLAPQDWFDGHQRRSPFPTVQSIFDAMRLHWVEEGASEAAFSRYRKASQGGLKVRDFGALVEVLANEIFDRQVSDEDRKATFLEGLSAPARNFVRQVHATQAASFGAVPQLDFEGLVRMASRFDTLKARSAAQPISSTSNPGSSRPAAAGTTDSSPSKPSPEPASDTGVVKSWVELASSWQDRFPVSNKASWFKKDAKELTNVVRCYNCTRNGHHPSSGCPNPRQDPQTVIIASMTKLSSLPPSPPPTSVPLSTEESEGDVPSSPSAGKDVGV